MPNYLSRWATRLHRRFRTRGGMQALGLAGLLGLLPALPVCAQESDPANEQQPAIAAEQPEGLSLDLAISGVDTQGAKLRAAHTRDLQRDVFAWLESAPVAADVKQQILAQWQDGTLPQSPDDQLDHLLASFVLAYAELQPVADYCRPGAWPAANPAAGPPAIAENLPPFVANQARLCLGKALVRYGLYEEGLAELETLDAAAVAAPAELLFYLAVAYHRLLRQPEALATIERLLQEVEDCPQRYRVVASLMQADAEALTADSPEHISRRMEDIGRRLSLGRAGPNVRRIEDGVVEALDKLIKEMEEQQQQQQQQAGGSSQGNPQSPAQDSMPIPGKGPGNVDDREIAGGGNWGKLPPRTREEILQQISKDLPPHYRELIEQYFRQMAAERDAP